ncbi:MAG: LLM class flavin-dependent oxidoreductase [Rhodospirillaceae bacterium]|nr:LLM class flavin-dependent oxidoreductase [Rhodospirillaceae bacterium]
MNKKLHLTGFMLYCPAPHMIMSWVYPPDKIRHQWYEIEYWAEIARTLERGKFDMFFFADGLGGGINRASVRYAIQFPTHDPLTLVPYLAAVTEKLGFAVTMSTTFYQPYMLARKLASIDHITKGRIGWNIVSSISSGEARNFGMDALPPHDERYDRADEFMDVVRKLWKSWDDGAVLMDMENALFAVPEKIHKIDHKGKWFDVQGPLAVLPSPQGVPYLFQAGSSDRGRDFAAKHAECVFGSSAGTKQMRAMVDDIRDRAERYGRDPEKIKFIWSAQPLVAASESEARTRHAEIRARIPLEAQLSLMSAHFNCNLTRYDLDVPVRQLDLDIQGTRGMLETYMRGNKDITLREIAGTYLSSSDDSPMVGTPEQVADYFAYLIEEGGGDGFQITPSYYAPDFYMDIVDLLVPVLQKRGMLRKDYGNEATLRDRMQG